jgi:hypothetical protein
MEVDSHFEWRDFAAVLFPLRFESVDKHFQVGLAVN